MAQVEVIHTAFEENPRTVALVEVGERTGTDALEYAYRWTQNVMDSWSLKMDQDGNDDVTVVAELPVGKDGKTRGLRSTSMGDHMLLDNIKYQVDSFGFSKLI